MHSLQSTPACSYLPPPPSRNLHYLSFHAGSGSGGGGGSSFRFGGFRRRRRDYESLFCSGRKDWKETNGNSALEADLFKFMKNSENPGVFPTRKELVNGGRPDLAEAIVKNGGWLSMGWDLNEDDDEDDDDDSPRRIIEATTPNGSIQVNNTTGIQGILERLEDQRNLFFGIKLDKNKSTDLLVNGYSVTNTGSSDNRINEGDDIIEMHENGNDPSKDDIQTTCLQQREIEVSPTLHSLRSKREEPALPKEGGLSCDDWQELSDAYEFQENEMMKAQENLRSLFAKLVVLEGKISLGFLDAQKVVLEKQRKVDSAKKAVKLIRSICIVWPNSAYEVLLTGSFDGWTTQRRMERASRGDFSVWLKLYPGRYEIKFFVDNEWKIDPLRPIVYNNGFQNNLLIVT